VNDSEVGVRMPAQRRGAGRRGAICEAVFGLLAEVGYDRMTMDHVAERAHASKATIYRTWPDKPQMVVEAIIQHFDEAEPDAPDTGSLRGDLLALMGRACDAVNSADGDVISGLMTAAGRTPPLASALQRCLLEAKAPLFRAIVGRAAQRGEVPGGTDPALLQEVMHAMIVSHKLWQNTPMTGDYARHVVDDVLLPIMRPSNT
jgi:AcrR family transcriptional regulator